MQSLCKPSVSGQYWYSEPIRGPRIYLYNNIPLKMQIVLMILVVMMLLVLVKCDTDYYEKRNMLISAELHNSVGGNVTLNEEEQKVNNCLMEHKWKEIDYAFENPQFFNFSHHYFNYKNKMRDYKVYRIIKQMPKGAALHLHDIALLGPDYMVNVTYMDNLYVCFSKDKIELKFYNRMPSQGCDYWQLMSQARDTAKNITEFDSRIRKLFTLVVDNPDVAYPSVVDTWAAFFDYFTNIRQLLSYRPVWEQYIYDALKKFREDKIIYLELRTALSDLYELNGTVSHQGNTAILYDKVIKRFIHDYPDFIGAKLIIASSWAGNLMLEHYIQLAKQVKVKFPEIFAGFDLVGQEDIKSPLVEAVPILLQAKKDIDFFFHAGETDWYGTKSDENLVDAILLGTKRIGHGYALAKHPFLMKAVIENDIGVEVNLISNTVLSLVRDLRNHPLNTFLAYGMPVVLSSDDPGAWEAEPLSDDFYVAFVGASSKHSNLGLLKTLALNSLKYSALDPRKKRKALEEFNLQWNMFIREFNCSKY